MPDSEKLPVDLMSDRAIAEETLSILRMALEAFDAISKSPMARMMPGMPTLPKRA